MGRRPRMSALIWGVTLATGVATGISLASDCDQWYCDTPVQDCQITSFKMVDLCCRDEDGNEVFHCVTCDRYTYYCDGGETTGPAVNCRNPGDVCQ